MAGLAHIVALCAGIAGLLGAGAVAGADPLWVRYYNGPANHQDEGQRIALGEHVYVVGTSYSPTNFNDITLVSYDRAGNQRWAQLYDSPGHWDDIPAGLAIHPNGTILISALSAPDKNTYDLLLLGYAPDGQRIIERRFPLSGQVRFTDAIPRLALGPGGTIHLSATSNDDYLVVTLDASGNTLWSRSWGSPQGGPDVATDIAAGPSGEVYVTGYADDAHVYTTIAYSPRGRLLWVRGEPGDIGNTLGPAMVEVDPSGNPIVAGTPETFCGVHQFRAWKYDTNGAVLWLQAIPDDDPCSVFELKDMALDRWGNVLLTGTGYLLGGNREIEIDYQTVKIGAAGNLLWHASYDDPVLVGGMDSAKAVVADVHGGVLVTGSVQIDINPTGNDFDIATLKYDSAGRLVGVHRFIKESGQDSRDLVVDESGGVFVGGVTSSADENDNFVTLGYQTEWCAADLDGNSVVDRDDLSVLLAARGPCQGSCPEDLNADRAVNLKDARILVDSYGTCGGAQLAKGDGAQ